MTAIYAILLFLLMITPHEFGHMIIAKAVGVQVNEFAIGMGPAIFKKQKGETLYTIRALPLGGYCAMEGENEESDNPRAFNNKSALAKVAVLVAGSAMNVITALLIMTIMAFYAGSPTNTVGTLIDDGPAKAAGLQAGDQVIQVNGEETSTWEEVYEGIKSSDNVVSVTVDRDGKELSYDITPEIGPDGTKIIGVTSKMVRNPVKSFSAGARATYEFGRVTLTSLKMLVSGEASIKEVSGPVGIISIVGQTGKMGFAPVVSLMALISINLAMINMLPLPALDGGRILFVFIRKLTGKMISDKLEGFVHAGGMALLLGLIIYVTWNDIWRLF